MGNDDRGFFFLDKVKGNDNRDGQRHTTGLDFRWETGRCNLGEGENMGILGEH